MDNARELDPRVLTDGLLLIDKPKGMTSHDVVVSVRRHVRPLKVGHTGTLDPLATGLLILCVGEATKIAGFLESRDKAYRATALLGTQTDTQDIEGRIVAQKPVENISPERVREAAGAFLGKILQTPPAYSAVKVGGERAYKLARRNKEVRLNPRTVLISRLEIERFRPPRIELLVECSKGTYVRTLCSDLGDVLGVGGCLEKLRRLRIGDFDVADAIPVAALDAREKILAALLPSSEAVSHLPAIECSAGQAEKISHGMAPAVGKSAAIAQHEGAWAKALRPDGGLLAVGRLCKDGEILIFRPKRVLGAGRN